MTAGKDLKTEELRTALHVLAAALWDQPAPADPISEKDYAFFEAQAVYALPKDILTSLNLPDELRETWKQRLFLHYQAYLQSMRGLDELTKLLTAEGMKPVVLKGASFAAYYRSPTLRLTGDVDVILHPNTEENYRRACEIMEDNGFAPQQEDGGERHTTYVKNGVYFEVHRFFTHRKNEKQIRLDERIDRTEPVERVLDGVRFYTLPDLENGLVMLHHMELHLPSGLGLRHVLDWFVFADRIVDEAFLDGGFRKAVQDYGLERLMQALTRMGTLYFGLPEQTWCDCRDDKTCRELLETLISFGNFGRSKDPMTRRATTALNSYMSFRTLQAHGLVHWKAAQRHAILRPFAWLYQLFRYLRLAITRRSALSKTASDYREHREQKKLFDKLGIRP